MLQPTPGKPAAGHGKTTGWIHRTELARRGVRMIPGAQYLGIDDAGLHVRISGRDGEIEDRTLAVDSVVLCTGQEPRRALHGELAGLGVTAHLIGGADVAGELDAKRAIDQGTRLAAAL